MNKEAFIKELAKFLVESQVEKGLKLAVGQKEAKEWARLREKTPLFGYPTIEEAEETLTKFLK